MRHQHPGQAFLVGMAFKKAGQVPRDGRVADVGQTHFVQADAGAATGLGISWHLRKEAVENRLAHFVRC